MPTLACPICQRQVSYTAIDEVPYHPFCGPRCKLIDLHRWLNEEYRISEDRPEREGGKNGAEDERTDTSADREP